MASSQQGRHSVNCGVANSPSPMPTIRDGHGYAKVNTAYLTGAVLFRFDSSCKRLGKI